MDKDVARDLWPYINSLGFQQALEKYIDYRKAEAQRLATLSREAYDLGVHNGALRELQALMNLHNTIKQTLKETNGNPRSRS
jgi:hypothetical protein